MSHSQRSRTANPSKLCALLLAWKGRRLSFAHGPSAALLLHDPINSAFFDAQLPSLGFAVSIKILKSLAMKIRLDGFAHEPLGSAFLARRNLPNA
jgi:hypothetical protein